MNALRLIAAGVLLVGVGLLHAQEARDLAQRMAATYESQEFYFAPLASGKTVGFYKVLLPVKTGLEYLVLLASDEATCNAAVQIEDDLGRMVIEDKRPGPLAGVRFSPATDGTAIVLLTLRRASGQVGWFAMVGRRPIPRTPTPPEEEPAEAAPAAPESWPLSKNPASAPRSAGI